MKRDRDDTDFRAVRAAYDHGESACPFCVTGDRRIERQNSLAMVLSDAFPVTAGHSLVIPKRHTADYFDLGTAEVHACQQLIGEMRAALLTRDPSIVGFNIGVNCGEAAGQTVMHSHIHLIPRRLGDSANPRGGVWAVIPERADYTLFRH